MQSVLSCFVWFIFTNTLHPMQMICAVVSHRTFARFCSHFGLPSAVSLCDFARSSALGPMLLAESLGPMLLSRVSLADAPWPCPFGRCDFLSESLALVVSPLVCFVVAGRTLGIGSSAFVRI